MTHHFIHFGCWNNGGCPKTNPLTKTLTKLKEIVSEDNTDFLSICGDNYYPPKKKDTSGKKIKSFVFEELVQGFECLPKIPIYMTYGNHDFETGLFVNGLKEENNCLLTESEIDIVRHQFPNIHLQLNQSNTFYANTEILYLDTTIWDADSLEEYIKCYSKTDAKYTDINTAENLVKTDQKAFINEFVNNVILNEQIKNIIIVGHHPLIYWKLKKSKMSCFILNTEFNELLFENIYKKIDRNINYYYLCADLHQYQPGHIIINDEMNIQQYIVGTGGAEFDDIDKTETQSKTEDSYYKIDNIKYKIDLENTIDHVNGFLKCSDNGSGDLQFNFIVANNIIGGKKYKKRKTLKKKRIYKKKRLTKKLK